MKITVVGKGNVGGGLADLWERAGHDYISRGERPDGARSLAEYVKWRTGGTVAKAFNANFASLYERLGESKSKPSCLYVAEDGARETTEQLVRDAGYEPVSAGGLENARPLEDVLQLLFAIAQAGTGQFLYRIAPPDRL